MRHPLKNQLNNQRGVSLLILIMILSGIGVSLSAFMTLQSIRTQQIGSGWARTVALQAAKSSFVLLEAALKRRLWEVPPDSNCMKLLEFGLTAETPEGVELTVDAKFDPTTSVIQMVSTAEYRKMKVVFQKSAKLADASNFLVASSSTDPSVISQDTNDNAAASLIGKDRRIYFSGPVEFSSQVQRNPNPTTCGVSKPITLPDEISIIVQAERISALGGLSYHSRASTPPRADEAMYNCLKAINIPEVNYSYYDGGGGAVITSDYNYATNLTFEVTRYHAPASCPTSGSSIACNSGKSALFKQFYPKALFTPQTTPPYLPSKASDDGGYLADADKWYIFKYTNVGGSGSYFDLTCARELDLPTSTRKTCSSSEHFPKGFAAWRSDANLNGVLYAGDGEPIELPTIDWDNMEALEEDAKACGHVITSTTSTHESSYEECDISDKKVLDAYISDPLTNPCSKLYTINLDTIQSRFANFSATTYENNANKNHFLRRVVYSKVPLRLTQKDPKGILTSLPPNARPNLPVWFVNETDFYMQPYQPNQNKVTNDEIRQLYFNQDSDSNRKTASINMVMLSPEQVVIISPFHVPWTFPQMQNRLKIVGGKIRPTYHVFTDWEHQEEDGFKYGYRTVNISNLLLVSSTSATSYEAGFFLRGLWSGPDNAYVHTSFYPMCMLDVPGDTMGWPQTEREISPAANCNPELAPWLPKASCLISPTWQFWNKVYSPLSNFYKHTDRYFDWWADPAAWVDAETIIGRWGTPVVFDEQAEKNGYNSHINLRGTRVILDFDPTTPTGKRNLAKSPHYRQDARVVDVSDRRIVVNNKYVIAAGFTSVPSWKAGDPVDAAHSAPCKAYTPGGEGLARNGYPFDIVAYFNRGQSVFSQSAPDSNFSHIGALVAQELPMIQVSD